MLHIILFTLKIIGIILLCILGVLLLAVCCALFVPVRYRIEVSREEGDGKPPVVIRAKITWMLHLVNILACYPADVYVRVRIFLFTLFRIPEAEQKKKTGRRKKERRAGKTKETPSGDRGAAENHDPDKQTVQEEQQAEATTQAAQERTDTAPAASRQSGHSQSSVNEEFDSEAESQEGGSDMPAQESTGGIGWIVKKILDFLEKIKQLFRKIKEAVENIQYTIRHFCDKIKAMLDNIQYYQSVIESDPFQHSWSLCRKQLGIILKELKPDKFEADLIVGMEDPAATGKILAACGVLYPYIGQHIRVAGDFERAHIEGWMYIKGRIRAFTFLRIAVKVYMNKDVRTLIKLLKKEAV